MCVCSLIFFSTQSACAVLYCHRKIAKSNYQLRQVGPSVHMEQLGSQWTDLMKFDI